MNDCKYCEDLNDEKLPISISELRIGSWYYKWYCNINYCPCCGKKLNKYRSQSLNDLNTCIGDVNSDRL